MERTEQNSRPKITHQDRMKYDGLAQHPLARRWLLQRIIDGEQAAREAEAKGDNVSEERWRLEVRKVKAEASRLGLKLGGKSDEA